MPQHLCENPGMVTCICNPPVPGGRDRQLPGAGSWPASLTESPSHSENLEKNKVDSSLRLTSVGAHKSKCVFVHMHAGDIIGIENPRLNHILSVTQPPSSCH